MRKFLMISTALIGFAYADPAAADPIGTWVATAVFGSAAAGGAAFAVVSGVVTMAISVGISMIAARMRGKPKQEAVRTELTRPTSLPAYRFVYGKTWAPGTPVAFKTVGRVLYICYLLNSRASAGPFSVLFDKRAVEKTGNEFNFAGPGAAATNDPFSGHVRYWIGRGNHTTCPDRVVSETGGYFTASDAWRGRTVLWARLDFGPDESARERWPVSPPELNVDGNWSLVRDPRGSSAPAFSRNQALILLDALRNNPLRAYTDRHLALDTFRWAADVADETVPVKGGGTIPRYLCDGVLVFGDGAELEDQIEPLLAAGGARLTRIGGRLGVIPAMPRGSVKTITDFTDGQPPELVRWRSSDELYTEGVARYPAPDRAYESAETPVHVVPGAQAEDGGTAKRLSLDLDFVTDYRQAERLAKIAVMRSRMQRKFSAELFPDCFDLVAGSVCDLDLGFPYGSWRGKYEVDSIAPAAGINDEESIILRLPAVLTETSDAIYAWNPATEEQDVEPGSFDGHISRVLPPPAIVMSSGNIAAQKSGDTVVPGVLAAWNASPSASAHAYEYQWLVMGESGFVRYRDGGAGGRINQSEADGAGVISVRLPWPSIGVIYAIDVRTVGAYGESEWVRSAPIQAAGPSDALPPPQSINAAAQGSSRINVTATQSEDTAANRLLIYGNDVDSPLTAELLWQPAAGPSVTVTRAETGLASNTTRYYFARARDQWGNLSDFTESASATTA